MNVSCLKRLFCRCQRLFLALFLAVIYSIFCVVPVHAVVDPGTAISAASFAYDVIVKYLDSKATEAEKATALSAYKDHWSASLTGHYSDISYDALSEAVLSLNESGQPAQIVTISGGYAIASSGPFGLYHYSTGSGFGSGTIWNNTGQYFCTTSGQIFRAQYNPESILFSLYSSAEMIRVNLQNLYNQQATHFSNVLKQLTNFQTVIDADISNLGAKLKTIVEQSTKINTQFRDFVNGHTVDDIITAIGNISVSVGDVTVDSYDDTKLLATLGRIETQLGQVITGLSSVETAIKNIPFTDNTGILAALGRIETKLGDLNITGGSTDLTPVTSAIAALNENISKISTHAADKLFAVSVLPDTDGLSYVNGEFTYSVVEGTPFYTVSDPVDFEFLSDSSSALTTDHIYLPDPAETDTLMFVIDSSLAGLGLGDTLHNYLNNLFFSVYSGSGAEFMVSGSDFTPTTDGKFVYYLEFDGSDYFWLEVHDGGWLPGCFFAYPAQRIGESSSSGTMTFYANGTRYSFTLVDRTGAACPLTATVYDNGDILTSTVLRGADGLWHLTVSDGTDKILSADLCKRLDTALTGQETLTWFSWFYNYSAAFQSWLGDKLSGVSTGGPGGVTDLTAVTTRLDTIIDNIRSTPGDTACSHTYQQEATQETTCTLPGLMTYTCSKCGDSYSEIVSALGHDWKCTDHVEDVKDEETGEVVRSGYDIYTCSRCGDTYQDHSGTGAPEDYSDTSISKLVVRLFSRLGTFAGKLIAFIIGLFDKALSSVDRVITRFNELTDQITGFGGDYPTWLSGFWGVLPQELQLALTFAVVCMAIGVVGRKLVFS